MAQFSVYRNSGQNKKAYPYFMDVQSNVLSDLNTCLVMPLTCKSTANSQVKGLTPSLLIDGEEFVILSNMLTTIDKKILKGADIVVEANEMRDKILSAVDILIVGI